MSSVVAVNSRGHFAPGSGAALSHLAPEERFVAVTPGEVVPDDAEILVTLLDDPVGLEELLVPPVRWVHVLSTGIDGFPLAAAGDRVVTCSRGASATAISEWVLAVMLAYEKKLPESFVTAPWERGDEASLRALAGKTLGFVGLGAIGSAIARRALRLRHDGRRPAPHRRAPSRRRHPGAVARSARARRPTTWCWPPRPPPPRPISSTPPCLRPASPGVHLVNVSRGSLVDQDALLVALDDGTVGRATLGRHRPRAPPRRPPSLPSPGGPAQPAHQLELARERQGDRRPCSSTTSRRYRRNEPLHGVVDVAAGY